MSTSAAGDMRRSGRYIHANAILGPEMCARLAKTKVLLVGAGGIGCELRERLKKCNSWLEMHLTILRPLHS